MIDQRVLKLTPEFATYTIAKMGLWALTRTAAQGLAPDVRVNAIGPGPTLRGARQSEAHFAAQRAATVLGRGASPEEIAAALGFILDAPGLTGQLICIDGGQHLAWRTAGRAGGRVATAAERPIARTARLTFPPPSWPSQNRVDSVNDSRNLP